MLRLSAVLLLAMIVGCAARPTEHRTQVTTVLTEPLPAGSGTEVRVITVDYPPGVASPPHRHPGAIYAYVAEGEVECALDDGQVVRYVAGQAWTEKPGQVHRVSRNASRTKWAKLVVFFVTEPGKATVIPASER
jgi:quercetin dioxygenase-like cupin family protein